MNTDEILPPGYTLPAILNQDNFIRPQKIYKKDMKCVKCGEPFTLTTPYEKCNPDIRDLCIDCIWEYQNKNGWV